MASLLLLGEIRQHGQTIGWQVRYHRFLTPRNATHIYVFRCEHEEEQQDTSNEYWHRLGKLASKYRCDTLWQLCVGPTGGAFGNEVL